MLRISFLLIMPVSHIRVHKTLWRSEIKLFICMLRQINPFTHKVSKPIVPKRYFEIVVLYYILCDKILKYFHQPNRKENILLWKVPFSKYKWNKNCSKMQLFKTPWYLEHCEHIWNRLFATPIPLSFFCWKLIKVR